MAKIDLNKFDQDIDNFKSNKYQLYNKIREATHHSPNNVNYLWRRSWAAIILVNIVIKFRNTVQIRLLLSEAMDDAIVAIDMNPNCFEAHISYCTAIVGIIDFVGIKEKIIYSWQLKKHLDKANLINPKHYRLNHLYGCFYYAPVPGLNLFQKIFGNILYGPLPQPSYEKSLSFLFSAHTLRPKWIRNYLWVSKALIALKRETEALEWIDRGLQLGFQTEEDVMSRKQMLKLIPNLRNKH